MSKRMYFQLMHGYALNRKTITIIFMLWCVCVCVCVCACGGRVTKSGRSGRVQSTVNCEL